MDGSTTTTVQQAVVVAVVETVVVVVVVVVVVTTVQSSKLCSHISKWYSSALSHNHSTHSSVNIEEHFFL